MGRTADGWRGAAGEPLLFEGDDFAQADVVAAPCRVAPFSTAAPTPANA